MIQTPILYLPHGGGPLPLLGDAQHHGLVEFLTTITSRLDEPEAILVISAHWEAKQATVTSAAQPAIIYDYYHFPAAAYQIQYPAPGAPELAQTVVNLLHNKGIPAQLDDQRGFDHGLYVPLKLMYPDAEIPCIQLSLLHSLDPAKHIELGQALAPLRKQKLLILGSGLSFHNLKQFFTSDAASAQHSEVFDRWLVDSCTNPELSPAQCEQRLIDWENAPSARFCHPREEHLLPLQVCFGAAMTATPIAQLVFNEQLMGHKVSGLLWL